MKFMYMYFLIALLLRLLAIGRPFLFEDSTFPLAAISGNYIPDQPPLFIYLQEIVHSFLPLSEVSARFPTLLANMVILGLVYCMARRMYGKKPAVYAVILAGISHQIILNGLMVHNDSGLLPLFVLSALFMYLFLVPKKQKTSGLMGLSVFLTTALLTKNYAFLAIAFIMCDLVLTRSLRKQWHICVSVCISVLMFLVFISVFSSVIGIDFIEESVLSAPGRFEPSYFLNPMNALKNSAKLVYALTFPGFLLLSLSLLRKSAHRHELLLKAWIVFWFVFFLFPTGDKLRYFHLFIPIAFVLIAKEVSEIKTSLKETALFTLPCFLLLFMLNVRADIPYLTMHPLAFMPFIVVTLVYLGILRNSRKKALFLAYVCFSMYIVTDLSFHIVSPDYSSGVSEGVSYIQSQGLNPASVVLFIDMGYYANKSVPGDYLVIAPFYPKEPSGLSNRSYFILSHQYYVDPFPVFSELMSSCELLHSLSSKEILLLSIYRC